MHLHSMLVTEGSHQERSCVVLETRIDAFAQRHGDRLEYKPACHGFGRAVRGLL